MVDLKYDQCNNNFKQWKIGWGITALCNMSCPFCYSRTVRKETVDLPLELLLDFIERNHSFIKSINYGTGENSLSENWFEVVEYVSHRYPDIAQALTTNGYLAMSISKRQNRENIIQTLSEVDVSLDYSKSEMHNRFRGIPQAFEWAINTIRLCKSLNIITTIVMIGTNQTLEIQNLANLFDIAAKFGCYVRINIYRPVVKSDIPVASYTTLKRALFWIFENARIVSLCDPLISMLLLGRSYQDPSGQTSLRILPDGSITASTYLVTSEWRKANIRDVNLSNRGLSDQLLGQQTMMPSDCQQCTYGKLCKGGAMDRRVLWYSDLGVPDPYCPFRNADTPLSWKQATTPDFVKGPSVHDGYLPTMIFHP